MLVASQVARSEGLSDGYRIVINDGVNGCAPLACALTISSLCHWFYVIALNICGMHIMRSSTDSADTKAVLPEVGAIEAISSASTSCSALHLPRCQGFRISAILTLPG